MQENLTSIIVPVFNAGHYIEETLQMVEEQTFTDWELILVDDGSRDDSGERIRRYMQKKAPVSVVREDTEETVFQSGRIRLIARKQNGGAARARNLGMEAARGRYIAFLDADDIWMPEKLEKERQFMQEKNAAFVCTSYEFGDENARGTGKIVHVPATLNYRQALSRTVIFTTTVLLDRSRIGVELLQMPLVKSEDTAFWWQLLRNGFTAFGLDEVLAIYRRPACSLSSNKLEAIRRIWYLYRRQERLSLVTSACCFLFWAIRATIRRI